MITGYNTDIEYEGVVYHVQTEDKGLSSPVIMSLIYDRGTILASKRAPSMKDLINGTLDEEALAERLQRQHKILCAAISAPDRRSEANVGPQSKKCRGRKKE